MGRGAKRGCQNRGIGRALFVLFPGAGDGAASWGLCQEVIISAWVTEKWIRAVHVTAQAGRTRGSVWVEGNTAHWVEGQQLEGRRSWRYCVAHLPSMHLGSCPALKQIFHYYSCSRVLLYDKWRNTSNSSPQNLFRLSSFFHVLSEATMTC